MAALWEPTGENAVVNQVCSAGPCAFVVIGHVAGAPRAVRNPGCSRMGEPTWVPMAHPASWFRPQHQVGLTLWPKLWANTPAVTGENTQV